MTSQWQGLVTDPPTSWTLGSGKPPRDDDNGSDAAAAAAGPMTMSSQPDWDEENKASSHGRAPAGFAMLDRRDRGARRPAPPPLPLHERSPSENNRLDRLAAIRVVPYTPPRLESLQQNAPLDTAASASASVSAAAAPGSPSSSPSRSRRRRQRQRRRRSREGYDSLDFDDDDGGEDSDRTATTATSKRNSRPTSWASRRSSWGPSAVLAAAAAVAAAASAAASPSASASSSPAPGSAGGSSRAGKTGRRRKGHNAAPTAIGGNWSPATTTRKDDSSDEGDASHGPGSALPPPAEPGRPLARGSYTHVSASKLASPTTVTMAASAATATSGTPGQITGNKNITAINATAQPLAHSPRWLQLQFPQEIPPSLSQQGVRDSARAGRGDAPPSASPPPLGLPPASASFSAAAASYRTERSSITAAITTRAPQLPSLPSSPIAFPTSPSLSPSSAFFPPLSLSPSLSQSQPPPPTTAAAFASPTAASTTLSAPSLSPSPSVASFTSVSSSQAVPRPHSRRQNVIAVHADKTFSLVPPETTGFYVHPDQQQQPLPPATLSASSLRSPRLSFASTTVRSSSSHDHLSSDAFSSDGHPSSPLTATSATLQDRSSSSRSPFSLSLGSSTIHLPEDSAAPLSPSQSASSWNTPRLVGGLRKISKTPDTKRKGKARAVGAVPTASAYAQKHHGGFSSLDVSVLPPLSESSSPTTTIVASGAAPGTDTELVAATPTRSPKKKTSFASDQSAAGAFPSTVSSSSSALSFSASTISAATNYKVYAHSSSPARVGASSTVSARESSDSLGLLPSSSSLTNVEILGVSSPAAPPLPVLQRSDDPDQTFASLASYPSIASFATGISNTSSNSAPNVVILGASSPPAPSRYLDSLRDVNASADPGSDLDVLSSSPPLPPRTANTTTDTLGTLDSADSDQNYVLHGEPSSLFLPPQSASSSSAASLVTISRQPRPLRPAYSQESLVVPPLKTLRSKRSAERFGYYKARSRESLRRAASIKSISSIFTQEAASTFFAGQAFLSINIPPVPVFTAPKSAAPKQLSQQQLPALLAKATLPKRKPLPLPAPLKVQKSENYVVFDPTPKTPKTLKTGTNTRGLPDSWASSSPPLPDSSPFTLSPPSPALPEQPKWATVQMVEEHPHQWSSQLSTVMSESEVDVDSRAASPAVSAMSAGSRAPSGGSYMIRGDVSAVSAVSGMSGGRRSSNGNRISSSTHSRNLPSISSSLALQLDEQRDRNSRADSLLLHERPNPVLFRAASSGTPPARTVRDHDEHGDGLADLHDVTRQPSRSGLSGFFGGSSSASNNNGFSGRNIHSSGSMRSLRSAASGGGNGVFPSWARVYYGSGERRVLNTAPSVSDLGSGDDYMSGGLGDVSRPPSAFRRSPSADGMQFNIFNVRRRPRDVLQPAGVDAASMEGGKLQGQYYQGLRAPAPQGLRKMTSSVWSPHLRVDRRATRFSVWEPPSVTWSEAHSVFDRRNMQVLCFTVGFIIPFAWMIAAFLPLPPDPRQASGKPADVEFGMPTALKQRLAQADENRFQSARWWRTLNRVMSVFGLLVLGAIVALVVVGIQQGW